MKKLVLLIVVVLSAPVFATTYYVADGEYFGYKTISESDTLIMTGGGGHSLEGRNNSILYIQNTSSPFISGESGIASFSILNSSTLYFSGGCANTLDVHGNSTIFLSGGQISQIWSYYFFPADASHITVYCQTGWAYQNGYLSGLWLDDSAFNIKLVTKSGSDIFSNMTIIPEPATLLLLAVGGLLLKRK